MNRFIEGGSRLAAARDYRLLFVAVNNLPDRCAVDVAALAEQIGADKLELINWIRTDISFARLIESKLTSNAG
jgi:hypothetical protein